MTRVHGRHEIRSGKRKINSGVTYFIVICVLIVTFFIVKNAEAVYGEFDESHIINVEPAEWFGEEFEPMNVGLDVELQEYTHLMCEVYDVDFTLVMAVMQRESGYRTDIISDGGDYGLMQINKINHQQLSNVLGITDFLNPEENIHAGVYMMHDLFEKYGETNLVLMAYNMGESGARKLWDRGIFTTQYVQDIMKIQKGLMEL